MMPGDHPPTATLGGVEVVDLPVIEARGGELPSMVDAAEDALIRSKTSLYQRGGMLVRPIREAAPTSTRTIKRDADAVSIKAVEEAWLVDRLTTVADWRKFDGRTGGLKPIDCPPNVAKTYLARAGSWRVPVLVGVIEAPTLRPDGSLLERPGYDKDTGLLFVPGRVKFEPIEPNPTRDEALSAVDRFRNVFKGFPLEVEHDFSIVLAAVMTAIVRRSLPSAPMFAFNAPKMGSGKSLLADVVSLIATGRRVACLTPTSNPEEERKSFFTALLEGDPVISIDNVSHPLQSDALCTILTQETFKQRILGETRQAVVPTCATWLCTGNNLNIYGDLTTRVLRCDLDPGVERPEERSFDVNLYHWVPAHRGQLVADALTIMRAYIAAGRPPQGLTTFGRFEDWSAMVRDPLVWLGLDDPCLSRYDLEAADNVRSELVNLLACWFEEFGSERHPLKHVIRVAGMAGRDRLRDALMAVAGRGGDINPQRLGIWCKRQAKRIEGGYRLDQDGVVEGAATWKVTQFDSDTESNPVGLVPHGGTLLLHARKSILSHVSREVPPPPTSPTGSVQISPLFKDQRDDWGEVEL